MKEKERKGMMGKVNKNIKIADLWLASALSLVLKTEPSLTVESGRVLFEFPLLDETLKAIDEITNGEITFKYLDYSEEVKKLRGKMLQLKNRG